MYSCIVVVRETCYGVHKNVPEYRSTRVRSTPVIGVRSTGRLEELPEDMKPSMGRCKHHVVEDKRSGTSDIPVQEGDIGGKRNDVQPTYADVVKMTTYVDKAPRKQTTNRINIFSRDHSLERIQ
jgi:hypothetical protein